MYRVVIPTVALAAVVWAACLAAGADRNAELARVAAPIGGLVGVAAVIAWGWLAAPAVGGRWAPINWVLWRAAAVWFYAVVGLWAIEIRWYYSGRLSVRPAVLRAQTDF